MTAVRKIHLSVPLTEAASVESPRCRTARQRPVLCALTLLVADFVAMAVAATAAAKVVHWSDAVARPELHGLLPPTGQPWLDVTIVLAGFIIYLASKGRYVEPIAFWTEMRLVVAAALTSAGVVVILELRTTDKPFFTPALIGLLLFPVVGAIANRFAKRVLSRAGFWTLPVLLIGAGLESVRTALDSDPSLGYRVVGEVDPGTVLEAPAGDRMWRLLNVYNARRLFIAVDGGQQRQLINCALQERVPFGLVQPYAFSMFPGGPAASFSHDTLLLSFQDGLSRPIARAAKITFDVSVAAFLLTVTSPLFIILFVLICRDGGPMLFAHRRIGAHGRPFDCLKFRTMVLDADRVLENAISRDPVLGAEWALTRKLSNDPRITRIGRFLRRTSLDELPQLINVLRLEMSLVGPRPIVEGEIPLYGENIAQYCAIRPGLTGLWQVSGRSNVSYTRRVQLDVWYVNNWTIWHDVVVLLKTIPAVLGCRGAR